MKKKDILLSVIIVTRNPGDDIYLTLSSLLPLNRKNIEIVLKDNSDVEDLSSINDTYQFENFTFIHREDQGIYHAMNDAMNEASGKYFYFLNAGDQYYECDLDIFLAGANDKYAYFYGGFINLYPFPRLVTYTRFMNKYSVYLKCINHQSVIFHRRVFEQLGGYNTFLKVESDFLLITEMVCGFKGKKFHNYITIYKGGGFSTTYTSSKEQLDYYKKRKDSLYNFFELALLRAMVHVVKGFVLVKNYRKTRKVKRKS